MSQAPSALVEALRLVQRVCSAVGQDYAVIGGVAVSLSARPRATVDVDVLVAGRVDRLEAIQAALIAEGARVDSSSRAPELLMAGVRATRGGVPVDLLLSENPLAAEIVSRAVLVRVGDLLVSVAAAADLVLLKLQANRPLDLEDARAVLAASQIDMDALTREAEAWGLGEALARLRQQVGGSNT